jgi:monofunctional glycosyltransferase
MPCRILESVSEAGVVLLNSRTCLSNRQLCLSLRSISNGSANDAEVPESAFPDIIQSVTAERPITVRPARRKYSLRSILRWLVISVALIWSLAALILLSARWIDPPTTAVQIQRHLQAWIHHTPYHERYRFVPLDQISLNLQHAVIAAEDARFYEHHGFDWHQIQIAAENDLEGGRTRGASTITQQLVKNLFFGTGRSFLRKGAEFALVPVAELVLGKRRILEIYLNVVEWGPGIYGADSACRFYDATGARNIDRQQAARLAAILPAPLKRRPERMNVYPSCAENPAVQGGDVKRGERSSPKLNSVSAAARCTGG